MSDERLLSPAEVDRLRRAWPKWELGRVHVHRLADSHDLLTAAITARPGLFYRAADLLWHPLRATTTNNPGEAQAREDAAALRTLAALAQQLQEGE